MDNIKKYDIVIVGGGVAGISALHRLKRDYPEKSVLLIEKEQKLGGMLKSSIEQGFLLETGPTAYLKNYQHTMQLVEELGLQDQVIYNHPGNDRRYVYKNGKIHPIPESPLSFIFSSLFSKRGKIRILLEPFMPRGKKKEETVYHFAKRRFGKEVAKTVMDAFVSGVCAGDVNRLDIHSLFPKISLVEKKVRSFLLFLLLFKLKSGDKNNSSQNVTFRSLKKGMGQIGEAAEMKYAEHLLLGKAVQKIEENDEHYLIHTSDSCYAARSLVMATSAPVAAKLLGSVHRSVSRHLSAIPYASITTCQLGFEKSQVKHPLDGFGFLVPRHHGVRLLGGLFASGLFEQRAPQNHVAVKVYIGGEHDPEIQDLPEAQILDIVQKELAPILSIDGKPKFSHVKKINSAIPQYHLGHQRTCSLLLKDLPTHGRLKLIGNYLSGISVNEAIKLGQEITL